MDIDWTAPLALAGNLFVFVLGCALVLLVAAVGFVVLITALGLIRNFFRAIFPRKKNKSGSITEEGEVYDKILKDYIQAFKE